MGAPDTRTGAVGDPDAHTGAVGDPDACTGTVTDTRKLRIQKPQSGRENEEGTEAAALKQRTSLGAQLLS